MSVKMMITQWNLLVFIDCCDDNNDDYDDPKGVIQNNCKQLRNE